jgi:hypothetical protein
VLNFLPIAAAQKVVWTDRDGESGAGLTLHRHSLDSYVGGPVHKLLGPNHESQKSCHSERYPR